MAKWVVLSLFIWSMAQAASPYDGKTGYEILGIAPADLVGLSENDAHDLIGKAHRRLAIRLHPDHGRMKGIDEPTRLQMMKQVNEAADNLKQDHGRGSGNPPSSSPAGARRPQSQQSQRANPFRQKQSSFSFADFFREAQDSGFGIYRQMEQEREASLNPNQRFPRHATDAVYSALMGGGFGSLDFYERFPAVEAAFLEFMREHLSELFDPASPYPLTRDRVERLERAVEVSGNPSDLAKAVWDFKKSRGWDVGPDPCPYNSLDGPSTLKLTSGGSAAPPKKPSRSRARRKLE